MYVCAYDVCTYMNECVWCVSACEYVHICMYMYDVHDECMHIYLAVYVCVCTHTVQACVCVYESES